MAAVVYVPTMHLRRHGDTVEMTVSSKAHAPSEKWTDADALERRFLDAFDRVGSFSRLDIIIDSAGGALQPAIAMASAVDKLKKKQKALRVRYLIDGQCKSAATMIAFWHLDPVFITERSVVEIHMPRVDVYRRQKGKSWIKAIEKMAADMTVRNMETVYKMRIKRKKACSRRDVRAWMEQGLTMSPQQAISFGFCDAVVSRTDFERG